MGKTILLSAACAILVEMATLPANADCLFENGRSDWRIVIREDADPAEEHAARELQTNIVKIAGAVLPIVRENKPVAPKAVVIASSLPAGPDALVAMRTADGNLYLEGGSGLSGSFQRKSTPGVSGPIARHSPRSDGTPHASPAQTRRTGPTSSTPTSSS